MKLIDKMIKHFFVFTGISKGLKIELRIIYVTPLIISSDIKCLAQLRNLFHLKSQYICL